MDFPVWRISTVVLSVWPELTSLLASQNKNTIGSATLQSWRFKAEFVERGNLLPELVAASTYNINTGELDYDPAIFDPEMKWSTKTGHRVKALKCHNEVNDDNRNENETGLYGRLQA